MRRYCSRTYRAIIPNGALGNQSAFYRDCAGVRKDAADGNRRVVEEGAVAEMQGPGVLDRTNRRIGLITSEGGIRDGKRAAVVDTGRVICGVRGQRTRVYRRGACGY